MGTVRDGRGHYSQRRPPPSSRYGGTPTGALLTALLAQAAAAAMLACGLLDLCAPPEPPECFTSTTAPLPRRQPFNFHRVVAGVANPARAYSMETQAAKLSCVLHYFARVRTSMQERHTRLLSYTRKVRYTALL